MTASDLRLLEDEAEAVPPEPPCHFCDMEHPFGTACPGVADHWMSWS